MKEPQVQDVMTTLVVTFQRDQSLREAAERLLMHRISGGPVIEGGRVVGVISESDIARALVPAERLDQRAVPLHPSLYFVRGHPRSISNVKPEAGAVNGRHRPLRVCDWMTKEVVTVAPTTDLWTAARLINRHRIKRLPVVDDEGYLVGLLARADLLRAVTELDLELAG